MPPPETMNVLKPLALHVDEQSEHELIDHVLAKLATASCYSRLGVLSAYRL
jgi:hypothetical protein